MKRIIALLLAFLMIVMLLCSCDTLIKDDADEDDDEEKSSNSSSSSTSSSTSGDDESSSSSTESSSDGEDEINRIKEHFKSAPKYDYNLIEYITLPDVSSHKIKVDLDMIQTSIDSSIASYAVQTIVASRNDTVDMLLSVTERLYIDSGDSVVDMRGDLIYSSDISSTYDEKETVTIENLGSGSFIKSLEEKFITAKLGENYKVTYTIPSLAELEELQANYPSIYETLSPFAEKDVYVSYSFVSRKVREGDVASVTYTGYYTDDEGNILVENGKEVAFDGGSGTSNVYIGSRTFIVDFEKGLIGLPVGKEGQFKATFPSDYQATELAGKTVIFKATVKTIYKAPEYNLAFVQNHYGEQYTSIEEFESDLINSYVLSQIMDYLVKNSTVIKYPQMEYKLLKSQMTETGKSFEEYYGTTLEEYITRYLGYESLDDYIYTCMKSELIYYTYAQINSLTVKKSVFESAKSKLIDMYKQNYMMSDSSLTEEQATEKATEYVNDNLTYSYIYQEAIYTLVDDFIVTDCIVETIPSTYTSVTNGGSLFD